MSKMKKVRLPDTHPYVLIAVMLLAVFGFVQLVRAATGGISGAPGTYRYEAVDAADKVMMSNDTFSDMPGMAISFTTTAFSSAVIQTSFATPLQYTPSFNGCFFLVRAMIDGAPVSEEIPMTFLNLETRGHTFVTPLLTAGAHTATLQWRSKVAYFGQPGCVQARSMVVIHQ